MITEMHIGAQQEFCLGALQMNHETHNNNNNHNKNNNNNNNKIIIIIDNYHIINVVFVYSHIYI